MQEFKLILEQEGRVKPGDPLRGTISWRLDAEVNALRLQLFRCIANKRDESTSMERELSITSPAMMGQLAFSFDTPCSPCSYNGVLFTITWYLALFTEPATQEVRADVVISPTGRPLKPDIANLAPWMAWPTWQRTS